MSSITKPQGFGKRNKPRDWLVETPKQREELARQLNLDKDCVELQHLGVDYRAIVRGEENDVVNGSQQIREMALDETGKRQPTGRYHKIIIANVQLLPFGEFKQDETFARKAGYSSAGEMEQRMQEMYARKTLPSGDKAFPDGLRDDDLIVTSTVTPGIPSSAQAYADAYKRYYGKDLPDAGQRRQR